MPLCKFHTANNNSGSNTTAGLVTGGAPIEESFKKGKRNMILTKYGWVRRHNKVDMHGNVRSWDELMVVGNPGSGLSYVSNTGIRYPQISQVYTSSNSTGGNALQKNSVANVYVVFNHPVVFKPDANNSLLTVSLVAAGSGATPTGTLRLIGAGSTGGRVTVDTVTANAVTTFHVSNVGSGFVVGTVYTTAKVTGGVPVGVTFSPLTLLPSGTLKLLLANTAAGNTMRAVSNNTIANTNGTIKGVTGANNVIVFKFKCATTGTYKINAQTLANSATRVTNFVSRNPGAAVANLVLSGAVSNAMGTFTIRTATTGG
jgi:hypothetical protein